jgi:hypothetical protein
MTVGGPPMVPIVPIVHPTAKDFAEIRKGFSRANQCPGIPAGSPAHHYIPTRGAFIDFIRELCPWIATIDPEMSTLVREVADTHGPDPEQLMEWDSQLGPAGKSQLYNILERAN